MIPRRNEKKKFMQYLGGQIRCIMVDVQVANKNGAMSQNSPMVQFDTTLIQSLMQLLTVTELFQGFHN